MKPTFITLAVLLVAAFVPVRAAAPVLLAEGGQARHAIIVAANASDATKGVAAELAEYLGRMAGAKFAVQAGDGSRGIVLGTLAEFPDASLNAGLALKDGFDGREAFAIRTEKDRVRLIAATEFGVPHAAFTLLERLGCRWFFPAKEWEVVPRRPNLEVALDVTDRPRILARRIWYGYGSFPDDKKHPLGASCQKDYEAWSRHNRMASSFRVYAGHAWQGIILANKKAFAEHPEYLALVKGERKGEQLCVTQPEVRKLAVKWALDFFAKNPDREMVSLDCSDGDGHCECAQCVKLGTISNRVFGLANEAAKVVAQQLPGKMVGLLAYNEHSEPPDFPLEPNVYVQLTAGFIRGPYTFDQLAELWPKKCRNMGFYEYFSVWLWDFDKLPGGKGANLPRIRDAIQRYARLGATSMDAESGNNWGVHGLGYYVANQLMWNPDADLDALRTDFFEQAFGPAAKPMRSYYDRWAPEKQPLMSRGLIGELFRDLDEAARLAQDRADITARIDQLKHYLHYNHLHWLLDHEKDKAKRKQLTVDILALGYRTRYEYMNHWNAMQTTLAGKAAKDFDEPTWARNAKEPKPWVSDAPVTRAETEAWFRAGLDYFQPTPVQEVAFRYDDLVPVSFPGAKPVPMNQAFQRVEKYALASANGEPLEVEITVGTIAWYRDRPAAKWLLKDAQDQVITQGQQKLDGEPHPLTLKVPRAGTYYFECNDAAAGWRINIPTNRPAVWLAQRGVRLVPLGQLPERFFYVPRGTKQLQFFYSGNPCKVFNAAHKLIADVTANDEVVTLPVPDGDAGQVWSLSPHTHHVLWFFNAPNVLAASPAALLLPRELVKQDGLR